MMISVGSAKYTDPYMTRIEYLYDMEVEQTVKSTLHGWGEPLEEVLSYRQALRELKEHGLSVRRLMECAGTWDGD